LDKVAMKSDMQREMTENVGIVRNLEGLDKAMVKILRYKDLIGDMKNEVLHDYELQNIILLSRLVVESALEREESRGAHYRSDFSRTDDINWKRHIVKRVES
jgi:L-aspartate oxidase